MKRGPDEVDSSIIYGGSESSRSTTAVFRGRLWQAGQTISAADSAAVAVLECVVEPGEVIQPPLDVRVVLPNFADVFQRLVV